jgi:hypothetical protein
MLVTKVLKVQRTDGQITANALVSSGFPKPGHVLTFIAYSNEMKARILEQIANGAPYRAFATNDKPRNGEWFELPCDN